MRASHVLDGKEANTQGTMTFVPSSQRRGPYANHPLDTINALISALQFQNRAHHEHVVEGEPRLSAEVSGGVYSPKTNTYHFNSRIVNLGKIVSESLRILPKTVIFKCRGSISREAKRYVTT